MIIFINLILIQSIIVKDDIYDYKGDEYYCRSKVHCNPLILDTIQRSKVFSDNKEFLDMPSKHEKDKIYRLNEAGKMQPNIGYQNKKERQHDASATNDKKKAEP